MTRLRYSCHGCLWKAVSSVATAARAQTMTPKQLHGAKLLQSMPTACMPTGCEYSSLAYPTMQKAKKWEGQVQHSKCPTAADT